MQIETPKEFSFSECLVFLGRSKDERLHIIEQDVVLKPLKIGDAKILLEISNTLPQKLQINFVIGKPPQALHAEIMEYIREWFDLDRDLAPFYRMAQQDRLLHKLTRAYYGLRLIRIPDLFQALCWAIIGQQINLAFAYTLYRRFIESWGEKHSSEGASPWFFPAPQRVAELHPRHLMQLQFTGKKSEYIIGLAELMHTGQISKQDLQQLTLSEAREALLQIRGVGPWTASYVLMRCLGFRSAFPIEDIGLHNAIRLQLGWRAKPTLDNIRKLAAGWQDWEAYATFYLYRSLL